MNQRLRHAPGLGQGFTLVEVLVALLLVAIAYYLLVLLVLR